MKDRIDVEKLKEDASNSCCKESYFVIERNSVLRIGAGARVNEDGTCLLFIEISLNLCPGKSVLNTVSLEKSVQLAKVLKDRGYEITCHEGQINFEKVLSETEINKEYEQIRIIIDEANIIGFRPEADAHAVIA